jgi:cell division septal protein FtsQ
MKKPLPKTYEEACTEIERMNKKRKRYKEAVVIALLVAFAIGLLLGDATGYQVGYHAALEQFRIIGQSMTVY